MRKKDKLDLTGDMIDKFETVTFGVHPINSAFYKEQRYLFSNQVLHSFMRSLVELYPFMTHSELSF